MWWLTMPGTLSWARSRAHRTTRPGKQWRSCSGARSISLNRCVLYASCHLTKNLKCAMQAIKFMRDVNPSGHGGRVLNVSSIGGYSANQGLAFYHAAKFGESPLPVFTRSQSTDSCFPSLQLSRVSPSPSRRRCFQNGTSRASSSRRAASAPSGTAARWCASRRCRSTTPRIRP